MARDEPTYTDDVQPPPPVVRPEARNHLSGLVDLRFERMITPRVIPLAYVAGLVLALTAAAAATWWAFERSQTLGVAILIASPLLFLIAATALRVGLEFLLLVFTLVGHVHRVTGAVDRIEVDVERAVRDLERMQFWRVRRPRRDRSRTPHVSSRQDDTMPDELIDED